LKLVSLNIGKVTTVNWQGKPIETGFFKKPTSESQQVTYLGFKNDQQADLAVHGGIDKAIYCYPKEHYAFWEKELGIKIQAGAFGENLTTIGLIDSEVNIGDVYTFGDVELQVCQPRFPCFKLNIAFNNKEMLARFIDAERFGFYLKVIKEGIIKPDTSFELVKSVNSQKVSEAVKAFTERSSNKALLEQSINNPFLAEQAKDYLGRFI
tara:strand:- start:2035 stop:2661 length:627 start_codon:yes stop_codon:yes gene_type:complete